MNLSQAHVINEENVTNAISEIVNFGNKVAAFFTQIRDLVRLANEASTIMKDWAITMQEQAENVFECEYSVLLGFNLGADLGIFGNIELGRLQSSSLSSQV